MSSVIDVRCFVDGTRRLTNKLTKVEARALLVATRHLADYLCYTYHLRKARRPGRVLARLWAYSGFEDSLRRWVRESKGKSDTVSLHLSTRPCSGACVRVNVVEVREVKEAGR